MNLDDFKMQVKAALDKLSHDNVVFFAWLCAIRTFPFYCSKRYARRESRFQVHLYSVLNAMDCAYAIAGIGNNIFGDSTATAAKATSYAATAAKVATKAAATAATAAAAKVTTAKAAAAYDAYAAYDAAYAAAYAAEAAYGAAYDAHATAAEAAYGAATTAYGANAANFRDNTISLLLSDLRSLQSGKRIFVHEPSVYGPYWAEFQEVLHEAGCGYWSDLYVSIFENGFILDVDALQRRMNVQESVRVEGAAAVAAHLTAMREQGAAQLDDARIIILGEKGAGKTFLAKKLLDPKAEAPGDEESTTGIDIFTWKLRNLKGRKNPSLDVHIWDFAGHVITHALHRFFLSERCLYILVYDGRTEMRNDLRYWLDLATMYGKGAKILVLVNRRDKHELEIPMLSLSDEYPFVKRFFQFSLLNDLKEVLAFRDYVEELLSNNQAWNREEIPAGDFLIKQALQERFPKSNTNIGWISLQDVKEIRDRFVPQYPTLAGEEAMERILRYFTDMGVCRWYPNIPALKNTIYNAGWISYGIYHLIDWGRTNRVYELSITEHSKYFTTEEDRACYPEESLTHLFDLLKCYGLAYSTKAGSITVPLLMPLDRPDDHLLTSRVYQNPDSYLLQYVSETRLPSDIIPRLIVKHHDYLLTPEKAWRYGAILDHPNGATAFVFEKDRRIDVYVCGNHVPNRTVLLREIRKSLDVIFTLHAEKPNHYYRLFEDRDQAHDQREWERSTQKSENNMLRTAEQIIQHARTGTPILLGDTEKTMSAQVYVDAFGIDVPYPALERAPY